ncbi:amidohydrolase [Aquiflexum gelatinilyticum]|uniref:Omega-amidase YafV n=1 Tax=Aquiflexum gelatinilyticum TaxID=2961943 RepID=A0A9X2SZL1_9BACT|nr:amidohydrolase [Aquiflexum gelatinilyticum]MCR9016579.1 amidohydrolase [Aquiflexum gelatinilyticum]
MNPTSLKIALIQTDLYWKDKTANMAMLEEKLMNLSSNVDLIILPEMFSTGFTMDAKEVAEPMNFTTTKWMKQMAAQTQALVTGSIVIEEKGNFYNRLLWVRPDGKVDFYDKRHLFRMAGEDAHYDMGTERKLFELKGWKIMPQICYDLRFPVWTRNRVEDDKLEYDLLFYIASWPSPRISAWDILLKARAVENLSYSIGVNRIGQDGNGIPYSGHSAVYNFKGETLGFSESKEEILFIELDLDSLHEYREKFPAWLDVDIFDLQ